jgi:50S ribosomal subunit-associated GTPase HflX
VVISDTVGFIRELPHQLVEAFRATLEETIHADLLLHVVDAASPVRMEQIEQVNLVLKEIGADHVPQILVWNKIDAAGLEPTVEYDEYGKIQRVFVSAKSGAGLDLLREAIAASLKAALEARVAAVPSQSIPKTCTLEPFEDGSLHVPGAHSSQILLIHHFSRNANACLCLYSGKSVSSFR